MLELIFAFICSFILSLCLILVFRDIFHRFNILDNPKKYGKKRKPVPYSMGVVFFIAFFIVSFFFVEYNYKLGLIWVFGFFITGVSFIDDMLQVSAKTRLLFQIFIGAVIGITSIKIGYVSSLFGGTLDLGTFSFFIFNHEIFLIPLFFTILRYVFIFNALNWTDGIEGNTSGLSIISFFILFLLGVILFLKDDYEGGIINAYFIMSMTIILVGILIPFWFFDFRKKILMGDSGTMFLGFMLATIAIIAGGKIATTLIVFGIYSVDAIYVIINRLLRKKNPLKGDLSHLHHRLLKIGFKRKKVLVLIYLLSFFFGLTALFLDKTGKIIVFAIIVVVVIFINKILDLIVKK